MVTYFNVKLQFNKNNVDQTIEDTIKSGGKGYVCSVDLNNFINSYKSKHHQFVLNNALVNICDSSVMAMILSFIHNQKLFSYVGADLFLEYLKTKRYSYLFLGSTEEILSRLKSNIPNINPDLKNIYFKSLPFKDISGFDYKEIGDFINSLDVDIIWVSLGAPKQEQFMHRLLPYINRGVMFGSGAIFSFYSEIKKYKRAPIFFRKLKLEWLFRMYQEPKKISKRIFPNIPIIIKLIKSEITSKKN